MSSRLPLIALGSFVVGGALLFLFEYTVTRVFGVAGLFTAIVAGVFAIATPGFLEAGDDGEPDGTNGGH
jgi:hypothetical protein